MTRRPTIIDVAELAGVSKATVGRVINGQDDLVREETRIRVLDAIKELGYERNVIASSMRNNRTYLLALSIPDITNPFWVEIARGVQDAVVEKGYVVAVMNSDWQLKSQQQHLSTIQRNLFDGLIINPIAISNTDLKALNVPTVVLGVSEQVYPDFDTVGGDSLMAVDLALQHLFNLGHRRIGLITGVSRSGKQLTRYSGYQSFHQKHDLPLDDRLIIHCDFSRESGRTAMYQLMRLSDPPTAICGGNDILAIGALQAAQEMGLDVPNDISIIGMDNIYPAAITSPPLTTVAKPKYEIGVRSATFLLERLEANDPADVGAYRHELFACELIQRQSTANYAFGRIL